MLHGNMDEECIYIGEFKNGQENWTGIMRSRSSATYIWEFYNGRKSWHGKLVSHDPRFLWWNGHWWNNVDIKTYSYEWEFKNDIGCGSWKFIRNSGVIYEWDFNVTKEWSHTHSSLYRKMALWFMDNWKLVSPDKRTLEIKDGKYFKNGKPILDWEWNPFEFKPGHADNIDSLPF